MSADTVPFCSAKPLKRRIFPGVTPEPPNVPISVAHLSGHLAALTRLSNSIRRADTAEEEKLWELRHLIVQAERLALQLEGLTMAKSSGQEELIRLLVQTETLLRRLYRIVSGQERCRVRRRGRSAGGRPSQLQESHATLLADKTQPQSLHSTKQTDSKQSPPNDGVSFLVEHA